jgi:hypothetical protein
LVCQYHCAAGRGQRQDASCSGCQQDGRADTGASRGQQKRMDRRSSPFVLAEEEVCAQAHGGAQTPGDADRVQRQSVAKVKDKGQADD